MLFDPHSPSSDNQSKIFKKNTGLVKELIYRKNENITFSVGYFNTLIFGVPK